MEQKKQNLEKNIRQIYLGFLEGSTKSFFFPGYILKKIKIFENSNLENIEQYFENIDFLQTNNKFYKTGKYLGLGIGTSVITSLWKPTIAFSLTLEYISEKFKKSNQEISTLFNKLEKIKLN